MIKIAKSEVTLGGILLKWLTGCLLLFYPLSYAELGEERTKKYNWVRTFTNGTYYSLCYGYEPV